MCNFLTQILVATAVNAGAGVLDMSVAERLNVVGVGDRADFAGTHELRRILPPRFGEENQPCSNGRCDYGLTCITTYHGSFQTTNCVRKERRGGEGEQCRQDYPMCDGELKPSGGGYDCKCLYFVGRRAEDSTMDDRSVPEPENADDLTKDRRRALPPRFGEENQPCRNGRYCNSGLTCIESDHGSFGTTKCVRKERTPEGGEGQRCRGWSLPWYTSKDRCDYGLTPVSDFWTCRCQYMVGGGNA